MLQPLSDDRVALDGGAEGLPDVAAGFGLAVGDAFGVEVDCWARGGCFVGGSAVVGAAVAAAMTMDVVMFAVLGVTTVIVAAVVGGVGCVV
ncbi:uncharacterized protein CLUP02_17627 [Colletotrichum lupini]|uniref:Uncharacterized protein n=1 Tax=Colletotrichum lupini TaxID=145971 RepID=A0A9Q8WAJ4_9PEZI|nr:uncharacterized protein CLUP02_17627 [Colletotrichum lupini]UQC76116.1 hypothetical protein CLUP02_17627 [Colletotrichum lupini]